MTIDSAVFAHITAVCPYRHTLLWAPLSPKIAPFHGDLNPHLTYNSLRPSKTATYGNGISIDSAVFAQMIVECPYTLQWDAHFPLKITPSHGGYEPPLNTWFTGPIPVLNPNGISIGSAVSAGLTSVTDRQTDRPRYSVGNNRPHLRT